MSEELIGQIFPYVLIVILVVGIILVIVRGTGSSNVTTIYGATADMYTKDKKAAMEIIVEKKAKKKMNEQEDGEPE